MSRRSIKLFDCSLPGVRSGARASAETFFTGQAECILNRLWAYFKPKCQRRRREDAWSPWRRKGPHYANAHDPVHECIRELEAPYRGKYRRRRRVLACTRSPRANSRVPRKAVGEELFLNDCRSRERNSQLPHEHSGGARAEVHDVACFRACARAGALAVCLGVRRASADEAHGRGRDQLSSRVLHHRRRMERRRPG